MEYAHGRHDETQQLEYQSLSRGGPSLPPYDSTGSTSGYNFDRVTGNVLQRGNYGIHQPASGLYPHQQLQQQPQYWQSDGSGGVGGPGMDHRLEPRASSHAHAGYAASSGEGSSTFQHPRNADAAQHALQHQRSFPQLRAGEDPYFNQTQQSSSRQPPVSLRQQVLTPTFSQHGHFGADGGDGSLGGPTQPVGRMMPSQDSGSLMMVRSSSLPALYGHQQHGMDFHSPALSVDTAATFAGPAGRVFDSYSRPSSSSTGYYAGGGGAAIRPMSEHMHSSDTSALAATAAAAAAAAGAMGDMSYDTSNSSYDSSMSSGAGTTMTSLPSANTTLCDTSGHHKFSPDRSYGMVLPSSMGQSMPSRISTARDLYENSATGPYSPLIGSDGFAMSQPGPLGFGARNGQASKSETYQTEATMVPTALHGHRANASETTNKRSVRRPNLLPNHGSNYSIDSLLAITRAAEADPSIFPCPFCDKSYEGKHARSIWRRHLQDKHAIPLSAQPRRTRWDGDANRPKNAEERRQRMLESKRRWAQKRRRQKHLEAEAKAAAAAAAAAVAEAEKSNMSDSVIEQMRAWYEHAKAQVLDFATPGRWNSSGGEMMGGEGDDNGDSDGEDPDGEDNDDYDDDDGAGPPEASTSNTATQSGAEQKSLTPGRPSLAEASGISPDSPFALPSWLDQQPPSLRAAALAAIQAQRAEQRQRKRTNDGSEPGKSASKQRKHSGMSLTDRAPVMARTVSLPAYGESSGAGAEALKRTASQQQQKQQQSRGSNSASNSSWDPFIVPAVPSRPLAASPSEASTEPEGLHPMKSLQAGSQTDASLQFPSTTVAQSQDRHQGFGGTSQGHTFTRNRTSPYHHVGGVDHSPTPAGKRAALQVPNSGVPPMMSSSSISSSPVTTGNVNRGPCKELANGVQGTVMALRQSVFTSSSDGVCSSSSASPTSLGAAIALGKRPPGVETTSATMLQSGQSNPFSLDKHKVSPSRSVRASPSKRPATTLPESPRPMLYSRGAVASSGGAGMTTLIPSPSFAMGRQLPPLPGLNERSLGWGEDPMMLGSSSTRKSDEGIEFGVEADTPMRLFAGAFGKGDALPTMLGTPRSRSARQRELSTMTSAVLGNSIPFGVSGNGMAGSSTAAQSRPSTATLATPDRFTRPRGLSSVLRNLGGTPSAGLRFNVSESPSGIVSTAHLGGNAPSSTSKSWGALSSAMLDWPAAGGVELSPIRARMPLGERRDGANTLHFGQGQLSKPGSPGCGFMLKSEPDSGTGSPVLKPTTMTSSLSGSGLSALGAALTRPRGLSSLSRGGPIKRSWDAENGPAAVLEANGHDWKRSRP
ncbi:hypothetical protein CF327_g2584 [Tilletia walkeri]|nr:hypothetical protein CF327_g2584 [Tilletia walkeri]